MIKIIGIGSPFGEDQAGWKVVEILQHSLATQSDLEIINYDRPGVRLLSYIQNAECVYLIDAVKSGRTQGYIYRLENKKIADLEVILSTHDMGVIQTLQMGAALKMLPKKIILYGIEINELSNDGFISPVIEKSIRVVAHQIKKEVKKKCDNNFSFGVRSS